MTKNRTNISNNLYNIPNYLSFFMMPFFTSIVSPVFIEISRSFGVTPENVNLILVFFTLGTIIGRIILLFYKNKFKDNSLIIALYSVLVLLVSALYLTTSLAVLFIIYFLSGIILGIVMLIAGQLLMRNPQKDAGFSLTTAAFFMPLGFIAAYLSSPVVIKLTNNWRNIYFLMMAAITVTLILYIFTRNSGNSNQVREERIVLKNIFSDKNRNILFILAIFIIVFYVIAESSLSVWAPTYLRLEKSFSISLGGISLSVFWTAVAAGRFIINRIMARFKKSIIMIVMTVLSLVLLLVIFFSRSTAMILIMFALMGLSFSGLWPLIMTAGTLLYKKGRDRLLNLILLASSCGSFFAPYIIRSAVIDSMSWSIFIPVLFMGMVLILLILVFFLKPGFSRSDDFRK